MASIWKEIFGAKPNEKTPTPSKETSNVSTAALKKVVETIRGEIKEVVDSMNESNQELATLLKENFNELSNMKSNETDITATKEKEKAGQGEIIPTPDGDVEVEELNKEDEQQVEHILT